MFTNKVFQKLMLFSSMISLCFLMACAKPEQSVKETGSGKLKVVVMTSFLEDMAKQIAGDSVEIELIIPAGEDPHLYVAKPEDYKKLEEANLVLYHGLHFEGKMVDALEKLGVAVSENFPKDMLISMQEGDTTVVDPHFWFDLNLYQLAVDRMTVALGELVPEQKSVYEENAAKYKKELQELDTYVAGRIAELPEGSRYLITPHDAFGYFAKSYGMEVKAPQGVSTDSEVSNQDIQENVDFILEHQIKAVFVESTTDPARMQKLKEALDAKGFALEVVSGEGKELYSDSLAPMGHPGDNFIEMYKHNVDLIVDNLK